MKNLEDIAQELTGVELMCEDCGTEIMLFDDECSECGKETGFGVDGYYISLREDAQNKLDKLIERRVSVHKTRTIKKK